MNSYKKKMKISKNPSNYPYDQSGYIILDRQVKIRNKKEVGLVFDFDGYCDSIGN